MTDEEIIQLAEIVSLNKRMNEHLTLSEAEQYTKQLLTEMAYERKMFKAIITNLSTQIVQNWCLVRFAKLEGGNNPNLNHWKSKLIAHLSNAASNKIKRINSYNSKLKAISEVWVNEKEYATDTNVIDLTVQGIFLEEQLDIISVIASGNPQIINDYVSNL